MPASKRKRIRLTLGGMMLLILCLAVVLGWRVNKARLQREAVAAVKRHGGWVHYAHEMVNGVLTPGRQPKGPRWLRRLIGDEYFQELETVSFVFDESTGTMHHNDDVRPLDDVLALLSSQHGLKDLFLKGTQTTDAGLAHLADMHGLTRLTA